MERVHLADLPPTARAAWLDLRDGLVGILGDRLVGMWAHGGTTSIADPSHAGDLDTYVVLESTPEQSAIERIDALHGDVAGRHGVEWDAWYVLADAARLPTQPIHAWRERRRDTSWAIHRAHWLVGRYVPLHGLRPEELVPAPTWAELLIELDRELEHVERHVVEGDTDPYEATYAHLTGCRILHAMSTRNVAISKRAAGVWALGHLPDRWMNAVRAAIRTYDGAGSVEDHRLLADDMARFVAFVREHVPLADGRPAGALPRWSGF